MNVIDELLEDVAKTTYLNNGEIVAKACALAGVSCDKCNYPTNTRLFDNLLYEYSLMKIQKHYYNKKLNSWSSNNMTLNIDYYAKLHDVTLRYANYRVKLQSIWPCENCKKLFNPTALKKYVSKNKPKIQGVLNYV